MMNVLDKRKDFWLATGLSLLAALVFYFTTKPTMEHFDYTVRVALAFLRGHLGLDRHPGSWLSEMVPSEGKYYSVFPLGAVLSVVPVAFFQQAGWIHRFPAHCLTASFHCRSVLCPGFWKSHGVGSYLAHLSLFGVRESCRHRDSRAA